jgi:hypothetical protein
MGSVFLEGLHLHREMLDFRPLEHHALKRFFSQSLCLQLYQFVLQSICIPSFFFLNFFSLQTQIVKDDTWKLVDDIWDKKVQDIRDEASREIEEEKEKPQLLMASHFL